MRRRRRDSLEAHIEEERRVCCDDMQKSMSTVLRTIFFLAALRAHRGALGNTRIEKMPAVEATALLGLDWEEGDREKMTQMH